jgi:hypothetical protein
MILLARSKGEGNMLKFEDKTVEKGYVWYFVSPNLVELSKTLQYGSNLDLKIEVKDGKEYITQMEVLKTTDTNQFNPSGVFKCIRCGAKLKDDTYKTCYTCSMEIRKETANSPEEKEKQEVSKRQTVAHAVSRALIALQGQVDVNNINSIIDSLATKFKQIVD